MPKRTYKLTEIQKKAALRYYKKGFTTQGKLARKLKVSKQKVASFLKAKKIGKRRVSEFWSDVKAFRRVREIGWEEARIATKDQPYWARKRAARQGKQYKSYAEFWKEWREKWRTATEAEKEEHGYNAIYGEEGEFVGGTPR